MSFIMRPELRKTSEIPYHSDKAPGQRFVFAGSTLHPSCRLYVVGRKVDTIPANQPEWLDDHRHNCPTFYVLIGPNNDLSGLAAEIVVEGNTFIAEAPASIMLPTGALHHHRLIEGSGWSFHVNVRADYVESLMDEETTASSPNVPPAGELCRKAEPESLIVRSWEIRDGSFDAENGDGVPRLWKFIDPGEFGDPGLRLHLHQLSEQKHAGWREGVHAHSTDEIYIILPGNGKALEVAVTSDETSDVCSPISIYHEARAPHRYQHIRGDGLVMKILKL